MEPTQVNELSERTSLQLNRSHVDQPDEEMSVQDQILSSWYLADTTRSGLGVPTTLEFWSYAA